MSLPLCRCGLLLLALCAAPSHADPIPGPVAVSTSTDAPKQALYTEAEFYLRDAWKEYRQADRKAGDEEEHWKRAIAIIEQMLDEHPDWIDVAKAQNMIAKNSKENFPLKGDLHVTTKELEPVYRKYWALYNVGTAEFIRVIAHVNLRNLAKLKKDNVASLTNEYKAQTAARRLSRDYYYAQCYDEKGWMWQLVLSLRDTVDFYY